MPKFSLDLKSNVILVDGALEGPCGIRRIKMVLDTGSTLTTIPYETALGIGIDPTHSKKRIEITTASNREYVPLITVPRVTIFGFTLRNLKVLCLDLPPHSRVDGLLGLNVLKEFNLFLRFLSGVLEITR